MFIEIVHLHLKIVQNSKKRKFPSINYIDSKTERQKDRIVEK